MTPIAPNTLCIVLADFIENENDLLEPLPGRTCTVTTVPGIDCGHAGCPHVCHVELRGGQYCVPSWSLLRPITPPGNAVPAETRQPETVA